MSEREELINTFIAMTDSHDFGVAMDYLEKNNWDLTSAVDEYISTHNFRNEGSSSSNTGQNQPTRHMHVEEGEEFDYTPLNENIPSNFIPPMGLGLPQMRAPNPNPQPENQPESLLGGMMSGMQNFANSIGGSLGRAFGSDWVPGSRHAASNQQNMDIDHSKTSGRIFLEKFRDKNGTGLELPPFVDGSFEEIAKEAKRLRRPIFLYLHDHKGDSCTIVDQTVISEEVVKDLLSKFICVGVNIHSNDGQELVAEHNIPGAPYMTILYFDESGTMQNIGSRYAEEINVNSIFEMCDTAYDMMAALFDPVQGIPEFNVADSRLDKVETESFISEMEDKLKNKETSGFVETRRREPQIDPNTGMPAGMTEKQYEDMLLKESQRKELEEAMKADREKLQKHREQQEEEKKRMKEELEFQERKQQQQEQREKRAERIKENLPDEPAEDEEGVTTVQFRMPHGSEVQRRFRKTDTIGLLYDYIYSLGAEPGFESSSGDFVIIQNFPKKIFDDRDRTLEEEGLYPRCKLYLKEHSQSF